MKKKLYNLLMVTHRGLLEGCYRQVFFADGQADGHSSVDPIKTFDDYLTDFYLYLLQKKPKKVSEDIEGYYVTQIQDEKAIPSWLRQTFRFFLLEEHRVLSEMQKALAEYRKQLANQNHSEPLDITLMHVAFALAWFNQHESEQDRYLFFRSAYKHFSGFYAWPDNELSDKEVAMILGITHGQLRTRTSRLCANVRRLVGELNDAMIAALNKNSIDIAHNIFSTDDPDIETILEDLLDQAERDLPQYAEIISLRKKKRKSMEAPDFCLQGFSSNSSKHSSAMPSGTISSFEFEENSSCPSMAMDQELASIASTKCALAIERKFNNFEDSKSLQSFIEENSSMDNNYVATNRIVNLFKLFIGLS